MTTMNNNIMCAIMLMAVLLCGCKRNQEQVEPQDPRQAFVGDYTFVSTGDIDLYMGSVKVITVPMNKDGEMSITLAQEDNAVWIIAEGDSLEAYVSGNLLFMEPTTDEVTMSGLVMEMAFTYSKATLTGNQLSWTSTVDITATYQSLSVSGSGQVDIVATKKE